ncbi:MAG TPA: penicillin-binding protein 2 [Terriglobales bacterium]|nr:penicillin-binding protein 2 [Terriglobales bacterium]
MEIVDRNDRIPAGRMAVVQYGIVLGFIVLGLGLWQLQILQARKYAALAEQNRVRMEPIPAPRGKIYDARGRLLVDNYPSFSAYLQRDGSHDWRADLPLIASGLQLALPDLEAQVAKFRGSPAYQPIPIKSDITESDEEFIAAHRDQFPELEAIMASRRLYPKNGFAASLIGYVGEPTARQLDSGQYRPGAVVGKSGLEQYYNQQLMGVDGERRVLVNSHGRVVGTLLDQAPVPGKDLHLTLDENLQMAAELAIGDRPGAVVALDPRTGGVLALVSRPTFDPNLFAQGLSSAQWQQWSNNPEHPLLDKAIQAQLAPGSVFKLVLSVAGLQENIAETKKVDCTGVFYYYGHPYHCWIAATGGEHGVLGIQQAITQSCDIYFYTLGTEMGIDTIDKYAFALGLGRATGIDLPGEASGLVPTPQWKEAHYHLPWYKGETVSVAIGQGPVTVTPVQLARMVGGIASGGHFPRPHVDADATNTAGFDFPLTQTTVDTITAGMQGVVNPGGTAASAHLQGVDFGGKTGTAQTISNAKLRTITGSHSQYVDNAWFVGVWPLKNPEISVCVLFQRGAEGPLAARIASQVIKAFYQEQTAAPSTGEAQRRLGVSGRQAGASTSGTGGEAALGPVPGK